MKELIKMKKFIIFGLILSIIGLFIIFAEYTAPYDPIEISMEGRKAPSLEHIFGTDRLGRDIFSRIIYGGRISILIGLASVAIGLTVGTIVGIISGYYGRWIDNTIMRLMDSLLAFPGILLALVIIAVLGPGLINVTLAVGVSSIPEYARLARGKVLEVREMQYIEAVRSIGVNDFFIMVKHIIPNISSSIWIMASLQLGNAILVGSGLSFLGMGAQPPTPEWGLMTAEGRNFMNQAWWISTFPGLIILTTVLSINQITDCIRDYADPRINAKRN